MRVTLVHNPTAGDEQLSGKDLVRELAEAGYDARIHSDKNRLRKALEDPGELVVVAGGDGSVRRVALALAGRDVPMAILPLGTANNIARSLGNLGTVRELIASWRKGTRRRLRVGTISGAGKPVRFVESVGVGAFAELVSRGETEVDDNTARFTGNAIDRALLLLQRILAERAPRFYRLVLDGTDLSSEYVVVEAMNIPFAGPSVPLAPDADLSDGRLDLVTVSDRQRSVLAEYVRARLAGEAAPLDLPVRRGERVLLSTKPGDLHVDDKPLEKGPANELVIALEEEGVEVLV